MHRLGFWVESHSAEEKSRSVQALCGSAELSRICDSFFSLPLSDRYTLPKNSFAASFSNNFLYALLSLDGALR